MMNHNLPKQIGDYNKSRMMSLLRERGPTTRMALSRHLGISPTAVTRSISSMLNNGIIRECGSEESDMGRKPVLIELCNDFCYILGADIVGGTIKTVLADLMGVIIKYNEEPFRHTENARSFMKQLIDALRKIINETGIPREKIRTAVLGTPGIFDPEKGKSQFTFFLDGWDDVDIRAEIHNEFSIETIIENDITLDLVGESWMGVGRDYENILYYKLGQGLGARIVIENRLLRGEHNLAGEVGYMLPGEPFPKNVNYEVLICNEALVKKYCELNGKEKAAGLSDLCRLAYDGDTAARAAVDFALEHFVMVLLNSTIVVDPRIIVLGGDACNFREKEIAFLKQKMDRYLPHTPKIITSKLSNKACLFGAIKTGLDRATERIAEIW